MLISWSLYPTWRSVERLLKSLYGSALLYVYILDWRWVFFYNSFVNYVINFKIED